jgi:uncharacterized Zn finger protein
MAWDERRAFFEHAPPRAARGGIKAHSRRGAFGGSWWARRWSAVLEGFDIASRLGRGRSYARRGQVLEIAIGKGLVRARVQGSRSDPYAVTLKVKLLAPAGWEKLGEALAREARFVAKLLAGEMPEDVESAFEAAGLSLFPQRREDLETECSCPDWSNPCKHIAAVYYLLGEAFDRDPFLIFELRGLAREELVSLLGSTPVESAPTLVADTPPATPLEPLRAEPSAFWTGAELPADPFGEVQVPSEPAPLLKRLGPFPFWRAASPLLAALEPVYALASPRGLEAFLGPGPSPSTDRGSATGLRGREPSA